MKLKQMKTSQNAFFYLLIFAFINFTSVFAQQKDLALITGTVKDDLGKSISLEMRFITPGQMPAITRTNSDGSYQQVLKQGRTYLPVFKGYIEIGGFQFFDIGKFDKYQEFRRDYIVHPVEVGKELTATRFFNAGDTILSEEGRNFIKLFKEFFSINKNIMCTAYLSAPTATFKAKSKSIQVEEKGKIKNKKVKVTAKEVEDEFLQARSRAIEKAVKEFELPAKVFSFVFEYPKKAKPKKDGKLPNNVRIVIEKVLKI